jgi:putative transcriptional regulator
MTMASQDSSRSSLSGQLLVAMPQMSDPRFARTVVYLCAHSAEGAMGLVVNRLIDSLSFDSLLAQLGVEVEGAPADMPVHFGGPVESSRGFVLHTSDYHQDSTLVIDDDIALTATVDVLRAIARGMGPRRRVLALGYAGWAPGQLDAELEQEAWVVVPAEDDDPFIGDDIWARALERRGGAYRLLATMPPDPSQN